MLRRSPLMMKSLPLGFLGRCLGALTLIGLVPFTASATTVVPPAFEQLVNKSDYVIRGVVKAVTPQIESAPAGGKKIVTMVEIEVLDVVAGTPPEKVVLRLLGGKVGEDELVVEGAPRFAVGDDDILFVRGNGTSFSPIYALKHGRYRVLRDAATKAEYVSRDNAVPLHDTAEVALPMTDGATAKLQEQLSTPAAALTPAQFIQRIREAIDDSAHLSRDAK